MDWKHGWKVIAAFCLWIAATAVPSYTTGRRTTSAEIVNTGSTNRPGYRIVVLRSGQATYTATGRGSGPRTREKTSRKVSATIPQYLSKRLFADLKAAMPLSAMPRADCVKSVSFGSSTYVIFAGQTSPDLSCPGDPKQQALLKDAQEIARLLSQTKGSAGESDTPGQAVSHRITLEDDNKTVDMKVGDTIELNLGTDMDWKIDQLDESIVMRKRGVMPMRGSQGIFAGVKAGETRLEATGDPLCAKSTPPCGAPSRAFRVTLAVK